MKTDVQSQKTSGDLVLKEVWRAKDELSAVYDHDLDRLFVETHKREEQSGHPLVILPVRKKIPGK